MTLLLWSELSVTVNTRHWRYTDGKGCNQSTRKENIWFELCYLILCLQLSLWARPANFLTSIYSPKPLLKPCVVTKWIAEKQKTLGILFWWKYVHDSAMMVQKRTVIQLVVWQILGRPTAPLLTWPAFSARSTHNCKSFSSLFCPGQWSENKLLPWEWRPCLNYVYMWDTSVENTKSEQRQEYFHYDFPKVSWQDLWDGPLSVAPTQWQWCTEC